MKIVSEPANDVQVGEMKCGQIAIIVRWSLSIYVGRIVQRYENKLVTLGEDAEKSWSCFESLEKNSKLRVRILPKGTIIEL